MDATAPLELCEIEVRAEWIDYNGHMNVGYFVVAFDHATDALIDRLGMDESYRRRTGCTVFVLETHVTYLRELRLGQRVRVDCQVVDHDDKRIHYFLRMREAGSGDVAATSELMLMHVDGAASRSAPMPAAVLERLRALAGAHARLPRPPQLGQRIGIRRG